ncbi:heterokaryon incompatibility protein-domain-containing protein, partial [Phaeosphaeriaceae sp. PMI808]
MRLFNVETFKLETFFNSDVPEYAALSHTWGDEEVTFQDISTGFDRTKKGWTKILKSAVEAGNHNCKYIWVDTCCIDKSSSAELSEAINSMFHWYRMCKVCFAYLEDVSKEPKRMVTVIEIDSQPVYVPPLVPPKRDLFSKARWFQRGWTLQELIAPTTLYFYDSNWTIIGEKSSL